MTVFTLAGTDPGLNLALEEYLLETPPPHLEGSPLLLLYQNSPAVVIGKNQNPWQEVPLPVLAGGNPPLYRRISGGGAVYHDLGNLNFAFIRPQEGFSKEGNLDLVRRALARLGLAAERTPRGDLLVDGWKVSGNALCYRRGRVLHHGTLLVDADLGALRRSLLPGTPQAEISEGLSIDTKAVASVPMAVANLRDFLPPLEMAEVVEALAREAGGGNGKVPSRVFVPGPEIWEDLENRRRRHGNPDWLFGMTPAFTCRFGGGIFWVENGVIVEVRGGAAPGLDGEFFHTALLEAVFNTHKAEEESHGIAEYVSQARQNS